MSLLADLYLSSSDEEAVKYDTEPEGFIDREPYTSFTELELSTLWARMRGVDWDLSLLAKFRPSVLLEDGGERTIHRIPPAMTTELSGLTPELISVAASGWAATDELRCKPSDVEPIIEGLVRLAKTASKTGRNIYLWNCV